MAPPESNSTITGRPEHPTQKKQKKMTLKNLHEDDRDPYRGNEKFSYKKCRKDKQKNRKKSINPYKKPRKKLNMETNAYRYMYKNHTTIKAQGFLFFYH